MKHFASQSQVKQLIKAGYKKGLLFSNGKQTFKELDLQDLIELAGEDLYGLFPRGREWEADDNEGNDFLASNPINSMVKLLLSKL